MSNLAQIMTKDKGFQEYLVAYAQASERQEIFERFEKDVLENLDKLNRRNFRSIFRGIARKSTTLEYAGGSFSQTDFEGEEFEIHQGIDQKIRHETTNLQGIRNFWIPSPSESGYYKISMKATIEKRDPRDYFL